VGLRPHRAVRVGEVDLDLLDEFGVVQQRRFSAVITAAGVDTRVPSACSVTR